MRVFIDVDLHQAIADFATRQPAPTYTFKSQDTIDFQIYFVQAGVVQDFGSGFALKFGMIKTGDASNTILAYQTACTYLTDSNGQVYYQMQVVINTSQMATAIGTSTSIGCTIELRYQDSLNEIIHTLNLAATVYATILTETGVTPPNVSTGYPDASTIELLVHKNAPSGYAGLDSSSHLTGAVIPVDGQTVALNPSGQVSSAAILAYTAANFATPASGGTVSVTFGSTASLKAGSYVRIPIAGYYIVQSVTNATTAVLQNNGDPFNALAGVTITSGAVVLPAQAAAGGGGTGQSAYTTLTAGFTVPAVGATVSLIVASTAWMPGSGYALFIGGAGYYLVNSITDSTHVVVTNSGSAANQPPGTNVASGQTMTGAGPQGAPGATGASLSAYDALTASFTMPAVSANVAITIANTAWLSANQIIYIASAGYFQVATIVNATTLNVTNLPYSGNASAGATIASGSKVSPGGLQGPQGAGGAGLNAFTTLSANFTQPAIASTVTVNVGSTAWMAVGQQIFIQGGGYYTISSTSDLTHAVVINLGGSSNVAVGSTVIGSGTQNVTPAGTPGVAGFSSYTTTSASFVMPGIASSVTVTLASTAWMAQGQNVYVVGAGYFDITSVTDATHAVLINLGSLGNVSSGTTIPSGSMVSTAGATGPTGAPGSGGGGGTLSDATTTGISLINSTAGILKRLIQGANITLTDGGDRITIASSGGGGSGAGQGYWDPANGLFFQDDFPYDLTLPPGYVSANTGGTNFTGRSTYGINSSKKVFGSLEFATGPTNAANQGNYLIWGANVFTGTIPYGMGPLSLKTRFFFEGTLPGTGISYVFRFGIGQTISNWITNANQNQGLFFEYVPDNNSGQYRVAVGAATAVYTNTAIAPVGDAAQDLDIEVNAAWTSASFYINGVLAATVTTGIPTSAGTVFWSWQRGSGTTNFLSCLDNWSIYYPFSR